MIASQQGYQFVIVEKITGLVKNPLIKIDTTFIDFFERFTHKSVFRYYFAVGNIVNQQFGFLSQVIAFQQHFFVDGPHINTLFPCALGFCIKKVHLHACFENMIGCPGGAGAIAYRHFPGYG